MLSEYSSGMYSPEVFAISQLLCEIPCSVLCAMVYWIIMVTVRKVSMLHLLTQAGRSMHKDSVKVQLG